MIRMLSRFFGRYPIELLKPRRALAVIGDVHGCADLLAEALAYAGDRLTICVGDYVDRGPDSAAVLQLLMEQPNILCLGGNHEEMLLRFLNDPQGSGAAWLRHGGDCTVRSFGLDPRAAETGAAALSDLRDGLQEAMGPEAIAWLRARPDKAVFGNLAVVHAGADPRVPIDEQDGATLRWGHRRFSRTVRKDGIWVVHGHTVVPEAKVSAGRIAIDTGAYATGRLTLAELSDGQVSFTEFGAG